MPGVISQFLFLWVGDGYIINLSLTSLTNYKNFRKKNKKNNLKNKENKINIILMRC